MEPYCAGLLGVVHLESNREMKPTKVVPVKMMTHVLHYAALFTSAQVRKRVSSTVQVVGKFGSLHNPQKWCTRQISYKNYILDFPENYIVNTNMVGSRCVKSANACSPGFAFNGIHF